MPPTRGRRSPRRGARTAAELPLGGQPRGRRSIPAAPPPHGRPPPPGGSPPRGAHRPTPTKEKKGKNTPNETLQLSQQQAEALLPTQMRGSFQDPSSGEFLGGTGRKPPTFHADRRLQTVCCSCNEILIFPPLFFLSLAPLFFSPLVCVRAGSWSSQAEPAHFLYCIIPQAVCSLCKQAFPPRAARPGRGCAPGLAAQARAYSAASAPRARPHRAARPRAPARRAPRFLLGHPRGGATRPYESPSRRSPSPRGAGAQLSQKPREAAPSALGR